MHSSLPAGSDLARLLLTSETLVSHNFFILSSHQNIWRQLQPVQNHIITRFKQRILKGDFWPKTTRKPLKCLNSLRVCQRVVPMQVEYLIKQYWPIGWKWSYNVGWVTRNLGSVYSSTLYLTVVLQNSHSQGWNVEKYGCLVLKAKS